MTTVRRWLARELGKELSRFNPHPPSQDDNVPLRERIHRLTTGQFVLVIIAGVAVSLFLHSQGRPGDDGSYTVGTVISAVATFCAAWLRFSPRDSKSGQER